LVTFGQHKCPAEFHFFVIIYILHFYSWNFLHYSKFLLSIKSYHWIRVKKNLNWILLMREFTIRYLLPHIKSSTSISKPEFMSDRHY